jgi:hypothetical protein
MKESEYREMRFENVNLFELLVCWKDRRNEADRSFKPHLTDHSYMLHSACCIRPVLASFFVL